MDILKDERWVVPSQPVAEAGLAWLRGLAPRFSEGSDHERRRKLADRILISLDMGDLDSSGAPVATLAAALGMNRAAAFDVALVAPFWQPHVPLSDDQRVTADRAVARLVDAAGGRWDEETAVRLSLLVQAHDATRSALKGRVPPVPITRRVAPDGELVEVDLTDHPFGFGRHQCPGQVQAEALMDASQRFARMHDGPDPLVLPNAWDVSSAFALVEAGFTAIGTTSLGVAAAAGLPDATGATRSQTLDLAAGLVRIGVPITVDIEYGLGGDPAQLAFELSVLGAAGVNLEDGRPDGLAPSVEQAAMIRAVKDAAPELFVNARTDTWWQGTAVEETDARVDAYVSAGADGIFVPGLRDASLIRSLTRRLEQPVNLLAQLPVPEMRDLGVRRVSTGSMLFRASIAAVTEAARVVRDGGPIPSDLPSYEDIARRVLPQSEI